MTTTSTDTYRYEVGEEVLFRPDPYIAVSLVSGEDNHEKLPRWTIGEITARHPHPGSPGYDIAFMIGCARFTMRIPESAIEGVA